MRRSVLIVNFNGHPPRKPPTDEGFRSMPMGSAAFVRDSISLALDGVDWGEPSRGLFSDGSLEAAIELPSEGPVESFVVSFDGADPTPVLAQICGVNGWAAFDLGARAYLDLDERDRKKPGSSPLS